MESIYLTLGLAQSFNDEERNIHLTADKPAGKVELDRVTSNIIEALNMGLIVQVTESSFNESTIINSDLTSPIIIESELRPVPFRYAISPLNVLPSFMADKYYIIGPTPVAPYSTYPNYLAKLIDGKVNLFKPQNGDVAYVAESPYHYWTYYGIWPTGFWIETKQETIVAEEESVTPAASGFNQIAFVIRDSVYSQIDLNTRPELPNGAVITSLKVFREGMLQYVGDTPGEYTYSPTNKIINFNTPVETYERVEVIVNIK